MTKGKTYSAREIVLSLFPDTDTALIPLPEYWFELGTGGELTLHRDGERLADLSPVAPAGNRSTELCCDLCEWHAPRSHLQLFRAEVPGSKGRRYRYVSLCRDPHACEARRRGQNAMVERLLERLRAS